MANENNNPFTTHLFDTFFELIKYDHQEAVAILEEEGIEVISAREKNKIFLKKLIIQSEINERKKKRNLARLLQDALEIVKYKSIEEIDKLISSHEVDQLALYFHRNLSANSELADDLKKDVRIMKLMEYLKKKGKLDE